jgi:DNA mismatch repair protein PMS2
MSITRINVQDIHRITSGQVIIDLPTVLKELIENSLDANSSSLEINFNNYGLDSIEVIDNGDGIGAEDFAQLCQNHATSKLSAFEDLSKITTLGFRGEALSSLCSISTLKITTTNNPPKATSLEFSKSGELTKETICSRKKGTTIFITNIFDDLPVRRKDLNKNIKREFSKALTLISNYILISSGVKFLVNNLTKTGKRQNLLKSEGSVKIQDNLLNVFGSNALFGLIPVSITVDLNDQKSRLKIAREVELDYSFKIEGLISKSSFGYGRSIHDRQFWFVNKRPVNLNKFSKIVNEVYKSFNHLEFPCFILNFDINPDFLDLNVTPDKRTILLHNESEIMEEVRIKLIEFFDDLDLSVPRNTVQRGIESFPQNVKTDEKVDNSSSEENGEADEESHDGIVGMEQDESSTKRKLLETISRISKRQRTEPTHPENDDDNEGSDTSNEIGYEEVEEMQDHEEDDEEEEEEEEEEGEEDDPMEVAPRPSVRSTEKLQSILNTKRITNLPRLSSFKNNSSTSASQQANEDMMEEVIININDQETVHKAYLKNSKLLFKDCHCGKEHSDDHEHVDPAEGRDDLDDEMSQEKSEDDMEDIEIEETDPERTRVEANINSSPQTDNEDITLTHTQPIKSQKSAVVNYETTGLMPLTFSTFMDGKLQFDQKESGEIELDDIEDQDESEQLLTLTVSKKDFKDMKIIGQFNLGFILVIRDNKDLFIIDQHASDEKYNFEDLQRNTIFDSQRLIQPKGIELNSMDELTVLENLDIFNKNGFKVKIDENSRPGFKISLESLPLSKKTIFDVSDFNELIHLIKENPNNSSVRCSKIRSMFAMRACRKSIMIGQTLNMTTMTKVIRNLGTLEKPWNCPHGRPTMRHLMELKQWEPFHKDYTL